MQENEILEEIHRVREAHARECGYDVDVMFARMTSGTPQGGRLERRLSRPARDGTCRPARRTAQAVRRLETQEQIGEEGKGSDDHVGTVLPQALGLTGPG